jgi:hypothetical protein
MYQWCPLSLSSIAPIALAWKLIAQIGIYIEEGRGQSIWSVQEIIQLLQ